MKFKAAVGTFILGLLTFTLGTLSSRADVTIFTSRISWEAAMGGGTGNLSDNLNSGTLSRSGYTISGTAQNAFPNSNGQTTTDGSGYLRVLLESSTPNYTLFTFNTALLALGYDLNPQNFNLGATVNIAINGTPTGSYTLPATDVTGFVGFISDTPFTTFTVTTPTEAWHGIDNIEAYTVPEPSTIALLTAGLAGAWLTKRRCSAT